MGCVLAFSRLTVRGVQRASHAESSGSQAGIAGIKFG